MANEYARAQELANEGAAFLSDIDVMQALRDKVKLAADQINRRLEPVIDKYLIENIPALIEEEVKVEKKEIKKDKK